MRPAEAFTPVQVPPLCRFKSHFVIPAPGWNPEHAHEAPGFRRRAGM